MEVDVRERPADRMTLVLLEHRVMRRLLALDHHVDDRVQPRGPRERGAKLALADDERPRMPLAVEDARDEALLSEAPDAPGAELVGPALGHLQRDALVRHRRTMVAEPVCRVRSLGADEPLSLEHIQGTVHVRHGAPEAQLSRARARDRARP